MLGGRRGKEEGGGRGRERLMMVGRMKGGKGVQYERERGKEAKAGDFKSAWLTTRAHRNGQLLRKKRLKKSIF